MLSEAMIRHVVGQEGAAALSAVVQGAWDDQIREGRLRFHRTTRANIVWDYMAIRAIEMFEDADGIRCVMREDRPIFVFRELFAMRPKLHDRASLTRNYPTQSQLTVQDTGLLDDLPVPHLAFGYRLDAAEAGVEQCLITSPLDDWIIDLDDLASGNLTPIKGMFDLPEVDERWRRVDPVHIRRVR